jgi:uncharacterized repeat protein (TIGR01451 family)
MKKSLLVLLSLFSFFLSHAQSNPDFYVASNGVTCMCPNANFGDTGTLTINGQTNTFTKRSRAELDALMAANQNDPQIALTCTSGITNMSELFKAQNTFNHDISHWDTSNVTDMNGMFWGAHLFNQDIGNWDVSSVTNMYWMFAGADDFNQPLNNWNVGSVTNMNGMFTGAKHFNQLLNNWDVSNVTDMVFMFANANDFNHPLNNWNVSNVTNMSGMFSNVYTFNHTLNNWDVSNVTAMSSMFKEAFNFNQSLSNWDVSNVEGMGLMFRSAHSFNQPLDNWDVSSVKVMNNMFQYATIFNQPLNSWNVSNVEEISGMFSGASSFNQPLNNWDVSNVSNNQFGYSILFKNANAFNQDLSNWNFSNGLLSNFLNNSGVSKENYDLLIGKLVELDINNGTLGAENIEYCDAFKRQQLINNNWTITDEGTANGCDLNYISGQITYDEINDGCDMSDISLFNFLVNVNNGTEDVAFAIDGNSQFIIPLNTGNYTLSILNLNSDFTPTPASQTINFLGQNEIIENLDFCITANQQFEDLSIDIFPLEDAIPGFETDYQIIVSNNGTQTVPNIQVTFEYDANFQTYVNSTITPSTNTTNELNFQLTNLEPFSQEVFEITMLNAVPPTLNGGEILTFTVQVTPDFNDTDVKDNLAIYNQTVVNSFDPNDKMVVQGEDIIDEDIDQYLDYRIRFQNLGTANALNVKITDTISNNLDWTTFQPLSSSHDFHIEIIDGEQINYYFDNINLPFETADPEGSNGYITYKIKPKPTVQIGDTFENTAYIYFDFNLPIITNTVVTTVVDELDVESFDFSDINIYPNPAKDNLNISMPENLELLSVELFDVQGKRVKVFTNQTELYLNQLHKGVYFLRLVTDKGIHHAKFIKNK